MNPKMRRRIEQVRRRWWVVLVIAGLGALSALPLLSAKPTYAATSTLVLSSPGRNPVEDATMITGYSGLFNDPATIERLKTGHGIPDGVTFEARMVGASPILTIGAVANDPKVAQDSALKMAEAFTEDINLVRQRRNDKAIQETQHQLDQLTAQPGPEGAMNQLVPVVQQRLDNLRADSTDQVQELQPRGGVTEVAPHMMTELALRAGGGLLLGVLAALGLAALSTRVENSEDLLEKTGVETRVDVPGGNSLAQRGLREERLRRLANIVSLQDLPKSTVVSVTDCRGASGARGLAESLATLSAKQGYRTVLVYADEATSPASRGPGFTDVLMDTGLVEDVLTDGDVDSLKIMSSGVLVHDRYALVSREKVMAVMDELRTVADTVIIAASPITESVDSQPICAAADRTMLVVDRHASRASGVAAAVDALADVRAVLLGAVLVGGRERGRFGRLRHRRPAAHVDWQAGPLGRDEFANAVGGEG